MHTDCIAEVAFSVFTPICLCVCLFFRTISQIPMQVTKLDIHIFNEESWKSIYFGVKRSEVKGMSQKDTCDCWFLIVAFDFYFLSFNKNCILHLSDAISYLHAHD